MESSGAARRLGGTRVMTRKLDRLLVLRWPDEQPSGGYVDVRDEMFTAPGASRRDLYLKWCWAAHGLGEHTYRQCEHQARPCLLDKSQHSRHDGAFWELPAGVMRVLWVRSCSCIDRVLRTTSNQ